MFERFTDRARRVMALATEEAARLGHEYIGTEHILLGLIKDGSGVGANVLKNSGIELKKARLEVEKVVKRGPQTQLLGKLSQTPRAKRVIEYAIEESRGLNHNYVGTEHLLLGLLREEDGIACQVLTNLGVELQEARKEVRKLLGAGVEAEAIAEAGSKPAVERKAEPVATPGLAEWLLQQLMGELSARKDAALEKADYEMCAELREVIELLRGIEERLPKLGREKEGGPDQPPTHK